MKPILALPLPDMGHLLPMLAVLDRLQEGGAEVIVATQLDREAAVREAGFDFLPLAPEQLPAGWLAEVNARRSGARSGMELNSINLEHCAEPLVEALLAELPELLRRVDPLGLLVDPYNYGAASVGEALGLPVVGVDGALSSLRYPGIPEPFLPWPQQRETGVLRHLKQLLFGRGTDHAMRRVLASINRWRGGAGLEPLATAYAECDGLPRLCQHVRAFEPGAELAPPEVHYLGPLQAARSRPPADFDWERLDGRPLVYASVGTIASPGRSLFELIAEACARLDLQLVIGGGGRSVEAVELAEQLEGSAIVLDWAPQRELLQRAQLCITHAGLNTTMEALAEGVPLLALPIAFEQPGVAWRIECCGAGLVVPAEAATARKLEEALQALLGHGRHAERARFMAQEIRSAGGAEAAARLATEAFRRSR